MILHLSLLVSLCIFKTCMCWTLVMDQHDYCDHVYRLKNEDLIMVPLKCDQKKFSKFLKVEGLSLEFVWRLSTRWLIKQCSNFDSRAFSITISVHLVWVGAHNRRGWLQSLRKREKKREKKEEGAEPEADPERDQRTVFAYQVFGWNIYFLNGYAGTVDVCSRSMHFSQMCINRYIYTHMYLNGDLVVYN